MRRVTPRFGRYEALCAVLVVLGVALVPGCRPTIGGVDYRGDADPYRHERIVDPASVGGELAHRLVLIGDTGAPLPEDPTLELVGVWADAHPEKTTVLFLGDNIYPSGLQPADRADGERVLLQQIESTQARKIFIPGNHDWGFAWNREFAEGVLELQQEFLDGYADRGVAFEPRDGCPGPVPVRLVESGPALPGGLTLLVLDVHWWLLPEENRPVCEGIEDTSTFVERLREELAARTDEYVIVAAHHPIRSGGEHGGFTRGFFYDLGTAIFYLFATVQDLVEPNYRSMIGVLSEVLAENPPLAMVAGHDHSLQILDGGDEARLIVVSGAATKVSGVTAIDGTLFAHAHRGFVVFDFYDTGQDSEGTLLVQVAETGRDDEPVVSFGLDLAREETEPQVVPARKQGSLLPRQP
jgi:hypothetical protein